MVWCGVVWGGVVWSGSARVKPVCLSVCLSSLARGTTTIQSKARQGKAREGKARKYHKYLPRASDPPRTNKTLLPHFHTQHTTATIVDGAASQARGQPLSCLSRLAVCRLKPAQLTSRL